MKTKIIIAFIGMVLIMSSILGLTINHVAWQLFKKEFIGSHVKNIQNIASFIDGDIHETFTTAKTARSDEFQLYLNALQKIWQDDPKISLLCTLNYSEKEKRLLYAIDPHEIENDTIWVESDILSIGLTIDAKGQLSLEQGSSENQKTIDHKYMDMKIPVKLHNNRLFLEDQEILRVKQLSPLSVELKSGHKINAEDDESEQNIKINNREIVFSFFFSPKGTLAARPGWTYKPDQKEMERIKWVIDNRQIYIDDRPSYGNWGAKIDVVAPILNSRSNVAGVLLVSYDSGILQEFRSSVMGTLINIILGVSFFSLAISIFIARYFMAPFKAFSEAVKLVSEGNLEHKIILKRKDEFGDYANMFNEMVDSIKAAENRLIDINTHLCRFVPGQYMKYLGKSCITEVGLGDHIEVEMSVLFSDIRSFTSISEEIGPHNTFDFLNSYLKEMEPIINESHKGFIDKYIGDGIMALFDKVPNDAVNAGIDMLKRLSSYNVEMRSQNMAPIRIGIGINTGTIILGIIGGKERLESTVISDAVNIASRIEGMAKSYGAQLLISQYTYEKLQNHENYLIRVIDYVIPKGKTEIVKVYEVFDADEPEIKTLKLKICSQFSEAVELFHANRIQESLKLFQECIDIFPQDIATRFYIECCLKS